jgi:hypothetical protein
LVSSSLLSLIIPFPHLLLLSPSLSPCDHHYLCASVFIS